MPNDINNPDKLAFSTQCLPGSPAELKEKERMAEFHRRKALTKAQEELDRPELESLREQKHQAASEAFKERMRKGNSQRTYRRP